MPNTIQEHTQTELDPENSYSTGWLLVGSGLASLLILIIRGYRKMAGWLLPIGLIGAGFAILLQKRQSHIEQAEENILLELNSLDPIARALIITKIAEREINTYRKPGHTDQQ